MANFGFDPNEYKNSEGGGSYDPLPDGKYLLACEEANHKNTANGEGINAKFDVVSGEYAGRKVFLFFNTVNKSDKAQQIGREQLATWARACGKPNASDTDQLVGVPFMADIYTEKAKPGSQYGDQNRIGRWYMKDGSEPGSTAASKPTTAGTKPINDPAQQGPSTQAPRTAAPASKPAAGGKKINPWDDA